MITIDQRMRGHYDAQASTYDETRYASNEGRFFTDLEVRILKEWLHPSWNLRVLDMPAGTGRLSIPLATFVDSVVAADVSPEMLRNGREKASRAGVKNIVFQEVDGRCMPYADDTFDVVTSFKFLHLIPNDEKRYYIDEMLRVTKPGGKLILEFHSPFYGGILAGLRYRLKLRAMRYKCLFPGQSNSLLRGAVVRRRVGVKLPFSGRFARIVGNATALRINMLLGKTPVLRHLMYAIILEVEKPATANRK